jgi:hypothetical protein
MSDNNSKMGARCLTGGSSVNENPHVDRRSRFLVGIPVADSSLDAGVPPQKAVADPAGLPQTDDIFGIGQPSAPDAG